MGIKKGTPATEAQKHNYCIFLIKGHKAHRPLLQEFVPQDLLDKLCAVQDEILVALNAKGVSNGTT